MSTETDRIEADIADSRTKLNDTLSALGSKLSPGQMLDEVLGLARGQAGTFTANLGRQVRDNPLPAVLIAAGVCLYAVQRQRGGAHPAMSSEDMNHQSRFRSIQDARQKVERLEQENDEAFGLRLHGAYAAHLGLRPNADESAETFQERVKMIVSKVEASAARLGGGISGVVSSGAHAAADGAAAIGQQVRSTSQRAQSFYGESPLAGGAIVMALGAVLGAVVPLSSPERTALTGAADVAARTGGQMAQKGASIVEAAVDSIH